MVKYIKIMLSEESMKKQIAIVTGASGGIGKEFEKELLKEELG